MADLDSIKRVFLVAVYRATVDRSGAGKGYASKKEIAKQIVEILDIGSKEKENIRRRQIARVLEGYIKKGYLKKTSNNPVLVTFSGEIEEEIEKYTDAYLNLINAIKQSSNIKF